MPFSEGWDLLSYATDAENEERLFLRWAVMYQAHMEFGEFRKMLCGGEEPEDGRTAGEILESVREIIG